MSDPKDSKIASPRATPLVEDTSVAGGLDEAGRPVIVPKRIDDTVAEDVDPTDPREKSGS